MTGSASFSCVINNKKGLPILPVQTGLSHPSSTNRVVPSFQYKQDCPSFQYKQDCPILPVQTGLSHHFSTNRIVHPSSTNRIVPSFQYRQDCPIIPVQTGLSHHFRCLKRGVRFFMKFRHGACMYRKQQQKKPFNVTNTFQQQPEES